jgi:hypothetical protein
MDDNKYQCDEYNKIKPLFENEYFLLVYPLCICKETSDELLFYGTREITPLLKPLGWLEDTPNGQKRVDFYNIWLNDENRRIYNKIVFEPDLKKDNTGNYNLYTGFKNDEYEGKDEDLTNIYNMIDFICKNDKQTIKYILDYIAHILQYPYKKIGQAVILYSDKHGVGKNSIIELFLKLIDKKYTSKINTIDDLTNNFNSNLENKLFCYGDEIKARKNDLYNELKDVITRERLNIERKGKDKYMINDYCNYFFTTNNYNNIKIEKTDRRFVLIECPEYTKDKEFYDKFYKDINNENIIKYFFKILKERPIKENLDILETDYKKDIMCSYIISIEKYIYTNADFLNNNFLTTDELYNNIKLFENDNKYNDHLSSKRDMSFKLQNIFGDITHRTSKQRGYKFPNNIKNILKTYNKEYFEAYYIESNIDLHKDD